MCAGIDSTLWRAGWDPGEAGGAGRIRRFDKQSVAAVRMTSELLTVDVFDERFGLHSLQETGQELIRQDKHTAPCVRRRAPTSRTVAIGHSLAQTAASGAAACVACMVLCLACV